VRAELQAGWKYYEKRRRDARKNEGGALTSGKRRGDDERKERRGERETVSSLHSTPLQRSSSSMS
jgi:hypothetical protein